MTDASGLPPWLVAALWSGLVSSGLLLGAFAGLHAPLKHRGITSVMAVGAGILIAAASLDLIVAAVTGAGAIRAGLGLVMGGAAFSGANFWLARRAARHRKRCGECVQQPTEKGSPGSGLAIAVGTLLDAVPEAVVLGLETARIGAPGAGLLAAFAMGNIAEALSSASGMGIAGRTRKYIFGLWTLAALAMTVLAGLAAGLAAVAPPGMESLCNAFAAGALIAMVIETMVPEATHESSPFNGLLAVLGFLVVVALLAT
jgi:ZIP family zinc transporter